MLMQKDKICTQSGLSYIEMGKREKPALLFLHGFMGCKEDFNALYDDLKSHFLCFGIDLPAHGNTKPDIDLNIAITTFIKAHNLSKVFLLGYSFGGRLSFDFDLDLFEKIFIISSHLGLQDESEKQNRLKQDQNWADLLLENFEDFLKKWYEQPIFNTLSSQKKETVLIRRRKNNPHFLANALMKYSLSKQEIFFPQEKHLFFYGEEDTKYKTLYQQLSHKIEVKKASHAPHLENPQFISKKVIQYGSME